MALCLAVYSVAYFGCFDLVKHSKEFLPFCLVFGFTVSVRGGRYLCTKKRKDKKGFLLLQGF